MNPENIREAAERAAAYHVAMGVIDFLQAVQVQQEDGERSAVAVRALGLIFERVQQAPVVRQARQRVTAGQVADLLKQSRVVQQGAAQRDHITCHFQRYGEREGPIQTSARTGMRQAARPDSATRQCKGCGRTARLLESAYADTPPQQSGTIPPERVAAGWGKQRQDAGKHRTAGASVRPKSRRSGPPR